ncbi:hypothetical protein O181_068102 [Austropuccinia psidii MF-1]|uniref:Uncharacterized protein n=1 Tax=Austropuccinia psidii MF-1 TaxID=1389203 RepID=A0A9Q3I5Y5_9BASI|nr:hypothetical protein [Austropuccinia psidii MF-1]
MYGIDLHSNKDRYLTIGDNKHQTFAFLPFKRQITVNKVLKEVSSQIPIEGISVTDLNTTFFDEVRNSYTQDNNCSILCQLLTKDYKDNSLIHALDEIWKKHMMKQIPLTGWYTLPQN